MNLCVVGNGASALNKPNGKFIDKCDIVVRMGHFITNGYEQYVGSKTDIFLCRWFKCKYRPKSFFETLKEFWVPRTYETREKKYDHLVEEYGITNIMRYIPEFLVYRYKAKYPFRYIKNNMTRRGNEYLHCCIPDSGIVGIDMAIDFYPNYNIFISGFDNCKTGYYWEPNKMLDIVESDLLDLQENSLKRLITDKQVTDLTNGITV